MKIPAETLVHKFLRTYTEPFTAKEFAGFLSHCGVKSSEKECIEYLESESNVFTLSDSRFATRACAFTNQWFSMKPGRKELEKGVVIAGHRCMPFVDPDVLSCGISFVYKKHLLSKKVVEMDSSFVLGLFSLYGDEYSPQYIAQDPANEGMDLAALDYTLPPNVKITGFSTDMLVADGFKVGDRLLCRVVDWDNCIVEVDFDSRNEEHYQMTMADVNREHWYSELEKALLESFNVAGPLSSIEEQLALLFADQRTVLCKKNCGSIEELFTRTKKIGFELFGVETRLWFLGTDVPAVGTWNEINVPAPEETKSFKPSAEKFDQIPPYIVDAFVKDQLYNKISDMKAILENLYPNFYKVSGVQQKVMLLHLKNRHDILLQKYNRFADSEIGELRHKVLELFSQVNKLVYSIDLTCADLSAFPQQSLVILSQIFAHINHIIEVTESDPSSISTEINELYLSVEGMEFNFECVNEELRSVLAKQSKNGFVVIK